MNGGTSGIVGPSGPRFGARWTSRSPPRVPVYDAPDDQRPRYPTLHVDVPDVHVAEAERRIDPVRVLVSSVGASVKAGGEADGILGRAKHRRRRRKTAAATPVVALSADMRPTTKFTP
jgi:hypothetical protein